MGAEAVLLYNNPLLPRAEANNNPELLATDQAWRSWVCGSGGNSSSFHRGSCGRSFCGCTRLCCSCGSCGSCSGSNVSSGSILASSHLLLLSLEVHCESQLLASSRPIRVTFDAVFAFTFLYNLMLKPLINKQTKPIYYVAGYLCFCCFGSLICECGRQPRIDLRSWVWVRKSVVDPVLRK